MRPLKKKKRTMKTGTSGEKKVIHVHTLKNIQTNCKTFFVGSHVKKKICY